jgi:hypothetical protein
MGDAHCPCTFFIPPARRSRLSHLVLLSILWVKFNLSDGYNRRLSAGIFLPLSDWQAAFSYSWWNHILWFIYRRILFCRGWKVIIVDDMVLQIQLSLAKENIIFNIISSSLNIFPCLTCVRWWPHNLRAYIPYLTSFSELKIHILNMKRTLYGMKFSVYQRTALNWPNFIYPLFFNIESW